MSGFGYTKYKGTQAKELRDAKVKIHSGEECSRMYKDVTNVYNATNMLCAGGLDRDACQVRGKTVEGGSKRVRNTASMLRNTSANMTCLSHI